MRLNFTRLLGALLTLVAGIGLAAVPVAPASATTVPTSAATLGSGLAIDPMDIATSSNSNAKAVIWANGSYAAPVLQTAFSRDGVTWATSSVPAVSNETQVLENEKSARIAYSTFGVIMIMWITKKTNGDYVLHSSTSTDGGTWSTPSTLDQNASYAPSQLQLIASPTTGAFTAAWLAWKANPYYGLMTATTTSSSGAEWSTPKDIKAAGSSPYYPVLGVDSFGYLTAAWGVQVEGPPAQDFLVASRSSDGLTWSSPVTVSGIQPYRNASTHSMAVSPAGVVVIGQDRSPNNSTKNYQIEVSTFDGTWHTQYITPTGISSDYANGAKVAVSSAGMFAVAYRKLSGSYTSGVGVKTSSDGLTWSLESSPFGTFVGSSFDSLAVTSVGQVFISSGRFDATGLGQVRSLMPAGAWVTDFTTPHDNTSVPFGLNQTTSELSVFTVPRYLGAPYPLKVQSVFATNAAGALSSSANKVAVTLGASVSTTMTTTNMTGPVSYTVSPSLPSGLTLSAATGAITGSPAAPQAATDYTITGTPASGSVATTVISIAVTPQAPLSLVATPSSGQLSITFTPGNSGAGTISNYKYSIDNGVTWVTRAPASAVSPLVITGLTNATTYSVKLKAVTSLGDSVASVTVTGTPTPTPTITSAVVSDGSVSIGFTPPASPPATITKYQYSLDGGTTWSNRSSGTTASPLVITGLTNGTTYSVLIRSVMTSTYGTPSAAVSVTPATTPGAPGITSATPTDGTVTLGWTAPTDTGGSVVTGYIVTQSSALGGMYSAVAAGTCLTVAPNSTNLSCTVTGLTNGAERFFKIAAMNAIGTGSSSTALAATARSIPDSPSLSGLTAGNGTLSATFTSGADGGSSISSYEYSLDGGTSWLQTSPATTTSPMLITGLSNGTSYAVKIRAVNAAGGGAASTSTLSATPITTALAPLAPTGSPENQGTTLHWSAPTNPAGAPITGYHVQISTSLIGVYLNVGAGTCATNAPTSTATSCTVTGLTNGTSYYFTVTALNAAGPGAVSAASSAVIPRTTPDAPVLDSLTPGNHSVQAIFTPGFDGGNTVSGFEYSLDGGVHWVDSGALATATSFNITGLTNGNMYDLIIRAVNDVGPGAASNSLSAVPVTVPSAPTGLQVVYGDESATISFAMGDSGGFPITGLEYSLDSGSTWITRVGATPSEPLVLTNLVNGQTYRVRIRHSNSQGPGLQSLDAVLTVPTPRVEIPATQLTQGTSATVEGSGFAPLSDIRIVMHSTPVNLGMVRSDAHGNFSAHIVVPAAAQAGGHHLVFSYVLSGRNVVSMPFSVTAPVAVHAQLSNTGTQSGTVKLSLFVSCVLLSLGIALWRVRRRR